MRPAKELDPEFFPFVFGATIAAHQPTEDPTAELSCGLAASKPTRNFFSYTVFKSNDLTRGGAQQDRLRTSETFLLGQLALLQLDGSLLSSGEFFHFDSFHVFPWSLRCFNLDFGLCSCRSALGRTPSCLSLERTRPFKAASRMQSHLKMAHRGPSPLSERPQQRSRTHR